MQPTSELLAQLRRDHVELAREMTPEQRFHAGGDLFDAVVERMAAGIQMQKPNISRTEVIEIIRQRLAMMEKMEQQRELQ